MVFLERIWCFLQPMQKRNTQIYGGISDNFEEATSNNTVVSYYNFTINTENSYVVSPIKLLERRHLPLTRQLHD